MVGIFSNLVFTLLNGLYNRFALDEVCHQLIEPVSRLKEVGALIDRIDSLFVVMKV